MITSILVRIGLTFTLILVWLLVLIQKQENEVARKAAEPFWSAGFWKYLPVLSGQVDPKDRDSFATPNYLKLDYPAVTPSVESGANNWQWLGLRPLALKEEILAKTRPVNCKPGRYRPDDQLLSFLKNL
jgi:hypothetical protein